MSDALMGVMGTVLHSTLRGLASRQRATADNVANIQTPGFLATRVDFESSLRDALAAGSDPDVTAVPGTSGGATRLDGNNVNLDEETLLDEETGLRYQLALRAFDDRFGLLRTALRAGGG
jgi:flagellar basal-body rod protein FlgB